MGGILNQSTFKGCGRERFASLLFFVCSFYLTFLFGFCGKKKSTFQFWYYPSARIELNTKTSKVVAKWNSCFPASSGPEQFYLCGELDREVSS